MAPAICAAPRPRCKLKGEMINFFSPSFTFRFWRARFWATKAVSTV
jgi:hypothetical protein